MRKLVALGATLLLATACGGSSEDPKGSLVDAFRKMGDRAGTTTTLTLSSTPESVEALVSEAGGAPPGLVDKILNSSITLSQTAEQDPQKARSEVTIVVDGTSLLEMRMLEGILYFRVDVPGFLDLFGQDSSELAPLERQASAAGFDFVGPALEGEWIGISGLAQLTQALGASPAPSEDQQKLLDELATIFEDEATVTSEGEEDAGEHLVATVPLRATVERFLQALGRMGTFPGPIPTSELTDVPDESLRLDVWVADDTIAQIEFDFLQLQKFGEDLPPGVDRLALRFTFEEWDLDVAAPSDAVLVDGQELFQAYFGTLFGAGQSKAGKASAEEFDCSALEGAPREVRKQFAAQCPNLN
jgi:hypothetical protein